MGTFTDLLFARPSFLEGVARLFDFGGTLNEYNRLDTPEDPDLLALRSDWEALGQDYRTALKSVISNTQADSVHGATATG